MSDTQGRLSELVEIIRHRSFRSGRFTLASGAESTRYFNLKPTMMQARGAFLAADALLDRLAGENIDFAGGLEMGAVPLIGAMAALGEAQGRPIQTFFVRKTPKGHGTREVVEGLGPADSLAGKRIMVIDDVATSGGSLLKAVEPVRALGGVADVAMVLIDREEGAAEFLAGHGVRLISVFKASVFD